MKRLADTPARLPGELVQCEGCVRHDLQKSGSPHRQCQARPSRAAELERDEEVPWEQTQVLIQGVPDLATELDEVSFKYKARNKRHPQLDTGWYPTSMHEPMEDPGHALNKLTRPHEWLRREAISNLRIMQSLGRPRMARKVLTPWQDQDPGCSTGSDGFTGSDAEVQSPMQDTGPINESEESERGDARRPQEGGAHRKAGSISCRMLRRDTAVV
jgi:hypothetical protein